jgi:hypothetical protein
MTGSTPLAKKFLAMDSIWFRGCEKPGKVFGLVKISRAEERVGERDRVEIPHFRIVRQRGIDKENKRHVDFLMTAEPLLIEAKTLDLVEIDAARRRRHIERRMPRNRLIAEILGGKEHELLLSEVDLHLALDRFESPRQARRPNTYKTTLPRHLATTGKSEAKSEAGAKSDAPPKERTPPKAKTPAHPLPPDWMPSPEAQQRAIEDLGSVERATAELAKFRDYYLAKGVEHRDWHATWRNWVRRAIEYEAIAARPYGQTR